jgi:hypothetical protein
MIEHSSIATIGFLAPSGEQSLPACLVQIRQRTAIIVIARIIIRILSALPMKAHQLTFTPTTR